MSLKGANMNKTVEQLWAEFQKEMAENDKKVADEIKNKKPEEISKEFNKFVIENKCKIMGGKNGKQ